MTIFFLYIKRQNRRRIFDSVYWILKMYSMFGRMLNVIGIMIICSLFVRINMLRTCLKLNFIFGTNTTEYKRRCVFVYLQEDKNHENSFSKVFLITAKNSFSKVFWIKAVKVSKSIGDDHAEELFQYYCYTA